MDVATRLDVSSLARLEVSGLLLGATFFSEVSFLASAETVKPCH